MEGTHPQNWDLFRSTETEANSASEQNTVLFKRAYKLLKLVSIIFCFGVVLTAGVVTKGATFFMVSQISPTSNQVACCPANFPAGDQLSPFANATTSCSITERGKVAWIWTVVFAFAVPEVASFLLALRTIVMRSTSAPTIIELAICLFFELIHTIGVAILFFIAFPGMDSIRGVMATNAVCIMPAVWKLFMKIEYTFFKFKIPRLVGLCLTALCLGLQFSALVIWPVASDIESPWALPVGLFLTSFGWWESFVEEEAFWLPSKLWLVKTKMCDGGGRAITYSVVSLFKMATFFSSMLVIVASYKPVPNTSLLFDEFLNSFSGHEFVWRFSPNLSYLDNYVDSYRPAYVFATQALCAWAGYTVAKFACKYGIQPVAFALPLALVTPVTVVGLAMMCAKDPCSYSGMNLPDGLFFRCPAEADSLGWIGAQEHGWAWLLWLVSQLWLTYHVWVPRSARLAATSQMFSTPFYSSLVLDQSLMLNRRCDDGRRSRRFDFKSKHFEELRRQPVQPAAGPGRSSKNNSKPRRKISALSPTNNDFDSVELDTTTRIYGCATMWHENSDEIGEMLKSIFRIDEDYSARRLAMRIFDVNDPDYYEWETHIFFDDCMERSSEVKDEFIVNQFVRLLIVSVEEWGRKWYGQRNFEVAPPVKIPTPYGGRLVWRLPGGTQIICHLKDKNKIRHKKRWSQCMYMYYFLGYQLMENPELTDQQKEVRAENTYLLALDGDVDFQPEAIIKLVDLMKRNPDVGAACGRIHPTGSGYMQWYQMFEYAIGHWLQKATEHMMGCVLCSPGCFSLFRAKAVMDDNVMNKYTTVATQPRHYVQYDQGEDRWLCTLLLQRGWRVEYSAASDSFTACPEGFKEFYNQRRRWMPSTIANIADLLGDYQNVIKNNDDISFPYIIYQIMNMVGTILGPGSIFLMLVGAFNVAFRISNVDSLLINTAIVLVFVLVCAFCKSDHQVMVAMVLSLAYAIIMMAVLVGLALQMGEDGLLAPTSLSLIFVAGSFILAGILHPQEFKCLPMGVIYYITIPSMYLLLMIYSIFNLNNVSWGTREVPKSAADMAAEQEMQVKEEVAAAKKSGSGLLNYFQSINNTKRKGTVDFSFGNIFSCLLFTNDDDKDTKRELMMIADKLDKLEKSLHIKPDQSEQEEAKKAKEKEKQAEEKKAERILRIQDPPRVQRDEMINPYWMEDNEENSTKCRILARAKVDTIDKKEVEYWYSFIDKYLRPLNEDKEEKKRISEGLLELRNQMVMSFLILNCIWVVTIFLLQQNKDTLFLVWPFGPHGPNITWDPSEGNNPWDVHTLTLDYKYLELEPLGFVFMIFFALVMLIQMIGMILHRIMTLGHIVSSTHFRSKSYSTGDEYLDQNAIPLIKELQKECEGGEGNTMEAALEKTLQDIQEGDQDAIRRLSRTKTVKKQQNPEVMSALKRRHTQHVRRKTMRRNNGGAFAEKPIQEEDEDEADAGPRLDVHRTYSKMDPNGLNDREV